MKISDIEVEIKEETDFILGRFHLKGKEFTCKYPKGTSLEEIKGIAQATIDHYNKHNKV